MAVNAGRQPKTCVDGLVLDGKGGGSSSGVSWSLTTCAVHVVVEVQEKTFAMHATAKIVFTILVSFGSARQEGNVITLRMESLIERHFLRTSLLLEYKAWMQQQRRKRDLLIRLWTVDEVWMVRPSRQSWSGRQCHPQDELYQQLIEVLRHFAEMRVVSCVQ